MKPIAVLVTLALFSFHFVGAQTSPVYWELQEVGKNITQWEDDKFYQYSYNNDGSLASMYSRSYYNYNNANTWLEGTALFYAYNHCFLLSGKYSYAPTGSLNGYETRVYTNNGCGKLDTVYSFNLPDTETKIYQYDSIGQLVHVYAENYYDDSNSSWQYDSLGNLTAYTITSVYPDGSYSVNSSSYYYNGYSKPYLYKYGFWGLEINNISGDLFYNYYNKKKDSLFYFYNSAGYIDSTHHYQAEYTGNTFNGWNFLKKKYNYYTNQTRIDSSRTYNINLLNQTINNDSLVEYEYDGNNLYRATYYRWISSNNSYYWYNQKRITYGYLPTAVEETASQNNITLYPNPAADIATLTFAQQPKKPVNISIYTTTGQLVLSYQAQGKQVELPVQGLSNGLYIVKTELEGTTQTVRLSIVR